MCQAPQGPLLHFVSVHLFLVFHFLLVNGRKQAYCVASDRFSNMLLFGHLIPFGGKVLIVQVFIDGEFDILSFISVPEWKKIAAVNSSAIKIAELAESLN